MKNETFLYAYLVNSDAISYQLADGYLQYAMMRYQCIINGRCKLLMIIYLKCNLRSVIKLRQPFAELDIYTPNVFVNPHISLKSIYLIKIARTWHILQVWWWLWLLLMIVFLLARSGLLFRQMIRPMLPGLMRPYHMHVCLKAWQHNNNWNVDTINVSWINKTT